MKPTNLPHFWPLFAVLLIYLPLLISWGGRNECKPTQNSCQVWVSCAPAPPAAPTLMNQTLWVYPERIGTPTSFSRYSWDTSLGWSSWSFTQGLDRSVVRATFDLEFCRLSQVFSLWNHQLWWEIANGKFYGANPHFAVSIRSAWMSFLECTEDPAKVIHLLTREIPFPALQKKKIPSPQNSASQ